MEDEMKIFSDNLKFWLGIFLKFCSLKVYRRPHIPTPLFWMKASSITSYHLSERDNQLSSQIFFHFKRRMLCLKRFQLNSFQYKPLQCTFQLFPGIDFPPRKKGKRVKGKSADWCIFEAAATRPRWLKEKLRAGADRYLQRVSPLCTLL